MVRSLHAAGIEVVLDVVYNHTCEGGLGGPSLSWRGLDAATYYRLDPHGGYVDTTGCGNSLDYREPRVIQMTLDSLRYWVEEVHVDGFRFDLAPTLARGFDGFDREHPFLVAARVDPVLGGVKLIAEPWDVGPHGWRTGQFPPPFAEWNDRFRDGVRDFWLAGGRQVARGHLAGGVRDLATRLAGSADVFPPQPRAARVGQLRDGARRLHAGRPHRLRRQAQRGERREQPRRERRQPLVEPRRRGADVRSGACSRRGGGRHATCSAPCCSRPASP